MKHRITALGLAFCFALGLAACGGGNDGDVQPTPEPSQSAAVTPEGTAEPSATPIPDHGAPAPSDSTDAPGALCPDGDAPTAQPTPTPVAIGDPTAPPSEEPVKDLTAAEVYDLWTLSSSSQRPGDGFIDMSAHLDAYYDLDADDLESFVFYQPDMSSSLQELFLAKAKPGKVSSVKAACQSRLEGLREQAEFYPGTSEFVDAAKLESVGDWVMLAACSEADRLVKILEDTAN